MEPNNNLLVELHRWAWRQDENFTTDAFAHLLRYFLAEEPAAGGEVLERLLSGAREIPVTEAGSIEIRTQRPTEEHGIPDVRITGPGFVVLIEVKVGADVDLEQLRGYLAELDQSGAGFKKLILLTPYIPVLPEDLDSRVTSIRWHEVADWVEKVRKESKLSPISVFLCSQFLDFLETHRLVVAKVRSGVSEGLRKYLERAGKDAIFAKRPRSLELLAAEPDLGNLHDLLMLMSQVIASRPDLPKPVLDSGQEPGPWIGYNIEEMKYFFYLYLSRPETLIFQRFKDGVDPASFDGKVGRVFEAYGKPRWCKEIDLADPKLDFFSPERNRVQQIQILEEFLTESLQAAHKLEPYIRQVT